MAEILALSQFKALMNVLSGFGERNLQSIRGDPFLTVFFFSHRMRK